MLNGVSPLVFSLSRLGLPPEFYALYSQRGGVAPHSAVHNKCARRILERTERRERGLDLTPSEVLACIAFKQPINQAELDRLFDVDKRGLVVKLRDKLVEEFAGADGRLCFVTTQAFLQRFGLVSLQELTAASLSLSHLPQKP